MLGSAACVQRGFFVMRGNYAKVVAALTPGSHQLVDWTAPNRYPEETLVRPGGLLVMRNSMYRFSDTAHRGSYDRIPVAAKHDKGLFLPDGVTEVEPDSCLWRKREP